MSTYPAEIDAALDRTLTDTIEPEDVNELDARTRALEAKVGADDSPVVASHDYRIRALEGAAPSADAAYLRGRAIAATAPTDGQVLVWDAGAEAWVPTTLPAFRTEVHLASAHTIDSGEGGPWYTVGSWRYVASEWPGCSFELRCEGTVTTDGQAGQVRLIRADTLAAAGSTIELDQVPPANGSASLTLVDGVIYLLQQRFNIAPPGDSFTLLGARIHIARS